MTAGNGFKKVVKPAVISIREAVSRHGDSWRFFVGKEHAIGSDLVTFDGREKSSMWLMEIGVAPRIRAGDL